MYVCMYVCMYDMLTLQLSLTVIKFETIICLLTRGEEKIRNQKTELKNQKIQFNFLQNLVRLIKVKNFMILVSFWQFEFG